ncbi:MAG: lytic transglycosylase domain-containing protein [Pseudonocardiaceae bacterium]
MVDPSPSTRFRGIALAVMASGVLLVPALVLTDGPFGLPPLGGAAQGTSGPGAPAFDTEFLGASGKLPRDDSLSDALLAAVERPGTHAQAGPPAGPLRIPPVSLDSYRRAEEVLAERLPGCGLRWPLLAGLGQVISEHARGAGLDRTGTTWSPILGPRLDGRPGLARIPDTDGGRLDLDAEWDRAAGPMQILPGVWQRVGADSNGDGTANPHSVYDAALAAGRYLCEQDADLHSREGRMAAVFRYQRAEDFVRAVLVWAWAYDLRAEPDPAAFPSGDDLPALPAPQAVVLPDTPPPPGPPPRGQVRAPVSALSGPEPAPPRDGAPAPAIPPPARSAPPPSRPPPEPPQPTAEPTEPPQPTAEPTDPPQPQGPADDSEE